MKPSDKARLEKFLRGEIHPHELDDMHETTKVETFASRFILLIIVALIAMCTIMFSCEAPQSQTFAGKQTFVTPTTSTSFPEQKELDSLRAVMKDTTTWPIKVKPITWYGDTIYDAGYFLNLGNSAFRKEGERWVIHNAPAALNNAVKANDESWTQHMKTQRLLLDSISKWKDIVTINHLTIQRQNNSLRDLAALLDAEREQKEKFQARLRDAVAVIKRDSIQLVNCVYNKPK